MFNFLASHLRRAAVVNAVVLVAVTLGLGSAVANSDDTSLRIEAVSNRADLVTGGDVLLRVTLPRNQLGGSGRKSVNLPLGSVLRGAVALSVFVGTGATGALLSAGFDCGNCFAHAAATIWAPTSLLTPFRCSRTHFVVV